MADIELIEGFGWNAEAAAADTLNRVNPKDPFIAIWIDEKGDIRYAHANIDMSSLAFITQFMIAKNTHLWLSSMEEV